MQADSLNVQIQDTLPQTNVDTATPVNGTEQVIPAETAQVPVTNTVSQRPATTTLNANTRSFQSAQSTIEETRVNDTVVKEVVEKEEYQPISLYPNLVSSDSSVYKVKPKEVEIFSRYELSTGIKVEPRNTNRSQENGWVFGIALFSALLIIIVKVYFQKYLSIVLTSAVNFQLADKLIREKNILVRRVFVILNINFLAATSLYIYLLINRLGIQSPNFNGFLLYLLVFALLFSILFIRLFFLNFVAGLFDSRPLFREFIHNTYLLNKNLGLYLLPLVLSIFYLQGIYAEIIFYTATFLVAFSMVYRYLRSIQIILKHKVFYFYTILYLCTLEILPALVGLKFVLSLR